VRNIFTCLVVVLTFFLGLPGVDKTAVSDPSAAPSIQFFPQTGLTVSDNNEARFLSEFLRLGGVNTLGYPITQPFRQDVFLYQAFQRGVLQWRPELDEAYLANVLDWLSIAQKDEYLESLGIPRPLSDSGGSWSQVAVERESWLTEPAIAEAYRKGGGYARFGLPSSRPARSGPFVVQRFQRYSFQYWTEDVAGMPKKGSVVGTLVGDLVKKAGVIP
jgi:hypothetical protein